MHGPIYIKLCNVLLRKGCNRCSCADGVRYSNFVMSTSCRLHYQAISISSFEYLCGRLSETCKVSWQWVHFTAVYTSTKPVPKPYCRNVVPPRSYCETIDGTGASNEAVVWVCVQGSFDTPVSCSNCFVKLCGDGSKCTVVSSAVTAARTCRVRISFLSLSQNQLFDISWLINFTTVPLFLY